MAPEGTGQHGRGSRGHRAAWVWLQRAQGSMGVAPEGTGQRGVAPEGTGQCGVAPEGTGQQRSIAYSP